MMFYFVKPLIFGYCMSLSILTDAIAKACFELAVTYLLGEVRGQELAGQGKVVYFISHLLEGIEVEILPVAYGKASTAYTRNILLSIHSQELPLLIHTKSLYVVMVTFCVKNIKMTDFAPIML